MVEPLKLGRKILSLILVLTLLISSLPLASNLASAAPFIPGGQPLKGVGTLEGLIRARVSGTPGYYVNENLPSTLTRPPLSIVTPPGSTGETTFGVRGLAVWEAPNRFLLRWVPDDNWIPDDGYSLFRIINGQPRGLIDGLGTAHPSTTQVDLFNRAFGSAQSQPLGQPQSSLPLPAIPAPSQPSISPRFGDGLFTAEELTTAINDLRSASRINDQVRQSLKQRNLLGLDLSNAAVEKALNGLKADSEVTQQTKIISGQQAFVSRFNSSMQQTVTPHFVLPNQTTSPETKPLPVVSNRAELAQLREMQLPRSPLAAPSAPTVTSAQVEPVEDPVTMLASARKNLLTLANVNFPAAVAAGLGYVDTVTGVSQRQFVQYALIPTADLRLLLSGVKSIDRQFLGKPQIQQLLNKPQISVEFGKPLTVGAPFNLQGYALDHKAYLRWDDAADRYTSNILSGYVVERQLPGETGFQVLNPDKPVVKMYAKDEDGNLLEPDVLYTDETVANGATASYQIRTVDVFGRLSAVSMALNLTVFKTVPPTTPAIQVGTMAKDPDLSKPVFGLAPTMSVGIEDLKVLWQRGKITQDQLNRVVASGELDNLKAAKSIDEEKLHQYIESGLLSKAQFDELMLVTGKSNEIVRRNQLEERIASIRQSSAQKSGVVVLYNHSLEGSEADPRLAEDLREYRVYRSEALGKGDFSEPVVVSTIPLNQLALPYGSVQDPNGDLIYYDTNVAPGHYYAYWITARDGSQNESPVQSKPIIVACPSDTIPGSPQNPQNLFAVNEELTAPRPQIAGFAERVKIKAPKVAGSLTSTAGSRLDKVKDYLPPTLELHRLVVVGADEVNPDGSVTVGWLPSPDADVIGYLVYRAQDTTASALTTPPTQSDLDRLRWSLIKVNNNTSGGSDQQERAEDQVIATNQWRDKVTLPASGSYLYRVYLVRADTFGSQTARQEEEDPYVEGGRVTIKWTASTDPQIAGYRVYRSEIPREVAAGTAAGFVPRWDMIAQLVTGNEYVDLVDQSKVHYYQYKVSTVSTWGVESPATIIASPVRISTTIAPAVPSFLTPIAQPGQVQLRWKPVNDATQYTIYRSHQPLPEVSVSNLATVMTEMGLLPQLTAGFEQDEQGLLQPVEDKVNQLTEDQQLALFKKVKDRYGVLAVAPYYALDKESAAEVKWEVVQTLTSTYEQNEANVANNTVMTWTDTQVQYPQTYMYSIAATNEDQLTSGLSTPVSVGPQKSVGPDAPEPVTAVVSNGQVRLAWKAYTVKQPLGYVVYQSLEENGQYQQCSKLLNTNEFVEAYVPGQEWWYRVVIVDEVGLLSAATKAVKPAAPNLRLPELKIDLKPGINPGTKPGIILPPAIQQDQLPERLAVAPTAIINPLPGKIQLPPLKPAAPVVSVGDVTSSSVALSWQPATNVTQYKVYAYRIEEPEKLVATADGNAASCLVTGLVPSTKYFVYVVAANAAGDSPPSKVVSATTKVPAIITPPQVGTLSLSVTATTLDSITLNWTNTGSIPEAYRIYYYKTEEPERLLQTVQGTTTSFTAAGLAANTKYFFYITAYQGGKESLPSKVASGVTQAQTTVNPLPTPPTLPTTLKVGWYTVTNVKQAPVLNLNDPTSKQTVGQLAIKGLSPIPVIVDVLEIRGDTLTKGSVSLSRTYQQSVDGTNLVLTSLTLNATAGPAKVSGTLIVAGASPLVLAQVPISPEGALNIATIDQTWVSEYRLNNMNSIVVQLSGDQRGIRVGQGQLESTLGQMTVTGRGQLFTGNNFSLDLNGRLTGEFSCNGGSGFDLVVPRLLGIQVDSATLKINQGVIDSQASRISGQVLLPFVEDERTGTVTTPTDTSGAHQQKPGGEQERVNPGDIVSAGDRFNYATLSAAGNVMNLGNTGKLALKGSMTYLLNAAKSGAPASVNTQAQNQNTALRSMSITLTRRYMSQIPFTIDHWDGQGILPTVEKTQPLKKVYVNEVQSKAVVVNGSGIDTTYLLELAADQLKLSLPAIHLQDTAENVSVGGPGYRGFEILSGVIGLPPNGVSLRGNSATGQKLTMSIPRSTIFYGRNGLIGRIDTESTAGQSVDIWLNQDVAATMSGAAIDLDANQVKWSMAGTIAVPQLGQSNGQDRVLEFGAFSDPQGGLIFRIEPEDTAVTTSSGRSVLITGGTLKGSDLYLDGRLNVNNGVVTLSDLDFVALRLYMGRNTTTEEIAEPQQQAADYSIGLAAKPVDAKVKDFTMQATGVKVEQNRDGVWELAVTGAAALVNNLPLTKGTAINLDAQLDEKAGTFKAKLNYTYEQFLTIDVNVQYADGEFRGEGEFWFITDEEGDEQRSQATGTVQARVGVKDGVSFWLFKLGYGQSTKTWKCEKCGFEFEGNHPPTKCPGTKNGSPCTGTKDDFKTDWQCSLCKTIVHAKESPKNCEGIKDAKACKGTKDDYKQVSTPKTKEDAEGAGLMLGPVQINNIMAMMGYNVELPKAKDGTFDVPVGLDNDQKLYEWKTLSNGNMFFVAKAYMTIWHEKERFLTLEPVRLVIASGPAVEMEATIKREGKTLAYGKIGYYHQDRRFFLSVKVPKLELPVVKARLEDLNLTLDFSPKKQVVNLSYPEMVKLYITGSPWDFAGGFLYENDNGDYRIAMKARAQYGYDKKLTVLYIKAKLGLTAGAELKFPIDETTGERDFEFQVIVVLEADVKGGVKINDYQHEILHAYLGIQALLGKTVVDEWWFYGKAKLYYHIDLWLWEDEGEENFEVGKIPDGVTPIPIDESKDNKPK